jgi:uncharacterized phage-associated protein
MTISLPKLKAIIKYFCQNTDPAFLGKTKLMKLFYFLDFLYIKKYGISVTGEVYYHLDFGPIPTTIKNLVDSVGDNPESAMLSDTIEIQCHDGHDIHKVVCVKPFTKEDEEYFSETELGALQDICQRFNKHSTSQIVDCSHKDAPWRLTRDLEIIPYELAAEDSDCQVTKQDIELMKKISI